MKEAPGKHQGSTSHWLDFFFNDRRFLLSDAVVLARITAVQEHAAPQCHLSERWLGCLFCAQLLLQDHQVLIGQKHVSLFPAITGFSWTAAVYYNSMKHRMKGNSFLVWKLCFSTSVRNKEIKCVNKHIRVNPNKEKWEAFNSLKYF